MQAAVIETPGKVVVREVPDPQPAPGEVIVSCGGFTSFEGVAQVMGAEAVARPAANAGACVIFRRRRISRPRRVCRG